MIHTKSTKLSDVADTHVFVERGTEAYLDRVRASKRRRLPALPFEFAMVMAHYLQTRIADGRIDDLWISSAGVMVIGLETDHRETWKALIPALAYHKQVRAGQRVGTAYYAQSCRFLPNAVASALTDVMIDGPMFAQFSTWVSDAPDEVQTSNVIPLRRR